MYTFKLVLPPEASLPSCYTYETYDFGAPFMQYQDAENLVLESVSELNLQLDENQKLEISPDTQLFGRGSKLDSLGLVNMVVLVEEKTLDKFGKSVTIADERAMSQKNSPFRTVRTLSEYLFILLTEVGNV